MAGQEQVHAPRSPLAKMGPTAVRRRVFVCGLVLLVLAVVAKLAYRPYPSDRTPEGAYMRIARHISQEREAQAFAYLETEAQWACFTIRDARKKAIEQVLRTFPESERSRLQSEYQRFAQAPDGADVFALLARERKWTLRLRKDLSGIAHVEIAGERATVVTIRGTRYSFRRRDNGIWGLTQFTAELMAEAERASRDLAEIEKASLDYERSATPR
jgi:hypothetical protein